MAALLAMYSMNLLVTQFVLSAGKRSSWRSRLQSLLEELPGENTVRYLMPLLFLLLVTAGAYSALTTGHFLEGLAFMFSPDWESFGGENVITAMGQAFFTLSLGMGAIMAYGAYMPSGSSVVGTATTIAIGHISSVNVGTCNLPLVFANGLESGAGPGLMFIALPIAFGQMAGGQVFGTLFFVLVTFAAVTSSISLLEPAVAWVGERLSLTRAKAASLVGTIAWLVGLGSAAPTMQGKNCLPNGWNF